MEADIRQDVGCICPASSTGIEYANYAIIDAAGYLNIVEACMRYGGAWLDEQRKR